MTQMTIVGLRVCHQRLFTRSNASVVAPLTLRWLSNSLTQLQSHRAPQSN